MKKLLILLTVLLSACDRPADQNSVGQVKEDSAATEPSTNLAYGTLYHYRSAFSEFRERLQWIATSDPKELKSQADEIRKSRSKTKDVWIRILSGDPIGAAIEASGVTRDEEGERRLPWWVDPIGSATEAPLENSFERTIRSLPKLESDGPWKLQEIESYSVDLNDPAKDLFAEMAAYNAQGGAKTKEAQPQARVVASASAFVFRESDQSLLFINGIKWNHPLYSDGYTEFHLHISLKTGAVINDAYAYTTFPLEPGVYTQYTTMGKSAIEAVKLARSLMGQ